ncbi:MAG: hypothetical protein OXE41_11215, partial [Gammaproteobacteria bacterium]|nr:hypothetical protein [Gammaproteobacteria bacterium]
CAKISRNLSVFQTSCEGRANQPSLGFFGIIFDNPIERFKLSTPVQTVQMEEEEQMSLKLT